MSKLSTIPTKNNLNSMSKLSTIPTKKKSIPIIKVDHIDFGNNH